MTQQTHCWVCTLKTRIERHVYPNVHCITVYKSQDMEATQMSISRRIGKKAVVCIHNRIFSSIQLLSRVQLFVTPWTAARQACLSITNSQSLLKLMSIESVMPSNHVIVCRPLVLLPSIFPSIRVFSNESVLHIRQPNYWSFRFNFSPSSEYSGLVRIDWLDLLVVQGTLKSLLQHHSPKASILWHSAFFIVQLSDPYMTTGKNIALTRRTSLAK